jgi:hypothetical protein
VVDKDVVGADGKPPADVVPFLNDAKAKALPMVYLVDLKGKTVHSEPVPATPAAMIALLKQWSTQ